MSESILLKKTTSEPTTTYLKDYQVPAYLIDEIKLIVALTDEVTEVKSQLSLRRNPLSQQIKHSCVLNGEELNLIAIQLNGKTLTSEQYQVTAERLILNDVPEQFELTTTVAIYPQKNTALSGLYRSRDTYCTQCEAEGFRRITYFADHPDILSRFTTTIIADKRHRYLLSNGNLIDSGELDNGRHFATWQDPFKKPSYLFALVAGDFDLLQDHFVTCTGRDIDLRVYVEKGYGDQAHHALYSLQEAMRWDEVTYGREYDLDTYMIVAIGDFNMGAMENKGLNIFNTKYVLAKPETATDDDYIHILSVVGHEYFHNWSGNRVTCRDWFQLSLKEGLTIFRDQSFTQDLLSPAVMRIRDVRALREVQFPEDAGPLAHPVRPDAYIEINNFYTTTIYNKGAEVLRMLQTILGKTIFRQGMDLYFSRHDGQAVTIEDYVKAMEDVSGRDLSQFKLWYSQAGTPQLTVQEDYRAEEKLYTLTVTQHTNATPNQPVKQPFLIPLRMGLLNEQGEVIDLYLPDNSVEKETVLQLTAARQTFQFSNVTSRPIPSLLRNFSAPVKLNYAYAMQELQLLCQFDVDPFNRYEALQKIAMKIMLDLVLDQQQGKKLVAPTILFEIMEYLLLHNQQDKFLLAEMLALPSEKYVGEQMEVVAVTAIHIVREFLLVEMAKKLQPLLLDQYLAGHEASRPYHFSMEEVGERQLKNRCLSYLMLLPSQFEHGLQQFQEARNMTDAESALVALANLDTPYRDQVLQQFFAQWQHDALVMDKWFAIQAGSKLPNALQQVKKLMQHPAFDIKNPNKVYALIGTFVQRNAVHFHAENGEGYAFLRSVVEELDKLNPQIAARMVYPLTTWRRYDKERQALMREQLHCLLANPHLSNDVYELVSKSIE